MAEPMKPIMQNAAVTAPKISSDIVITLTKDDIALKPTLQKYLQFSKMLGASEERINAIEKVIKSLD